MIATPPGSQLAGLSERIRVSSDLRRRFAGTITLLRTEYMAASGHDAESNPLEDLIVAVSAGQAAEAGVGARDRRLKVVNLGPPHRPTKRKYDYFEELNAALTAKRVAQPLRPHS